MNANRVPNEGRSTCNHGEAVREALGTYALAKGVEAGLERARDAIERQLAEAKGETHAAWSALDAALGREASAAGEGRR